MAKKAKPVIEYRVYELDMDFPVLLLDGDTWRISNVKSDRLHFHNCLEIGVCHSDGGVLQVHGEPLRYLAGNVTCIPQHIPHTTYSSPGSASLWSYIFVDLRELLRDMVHTQESFELTSFSMHHYEFLFDANRFPKVHFLVHCILNELREQKSNYRVTVKALFIALYYEYLRVFSVKALEDAQKPSKNQNPLVITPALNHINANYRNHITIDALAEMCHLSTTHFRRQFQAIMGASPLAFINATRIDRAAILLLTTQDAVLTISETVGFSSVSSFNRNFSRVVGVTPREYRSRHMQDAQMPKRHRILKYSGWVVPDP